MKTRAMIFTLGLKKSTPGTFKGVHLLPRNSPRIKALEHEMALKKMAAHAHAAAEVSRAFMVSTEELLERSRIICKEMYTLAHDPQEANICAP